MSDIYSAMGKRAFGGAATKRSAPPATDATPAAKKPADPTNGLCQGHQTAAPQPPTERVPPFYIDWPEDWPALAEKLKELTAGSMVAVARGDHVRVQTTSIADFRAVQRHLLTAKFSFYTFSLKGCGG